MIKAETKKDGTVVTIETTGESVLDVLDELTAIIKSCRKSLSVALPEEVVDMMITTAGKMAYAETEEEKADAAKGLETVLDSAIDKILEMGVE